MTQLNMQMTTGFEQNLRRLMKVRHLHTKAEAVRLAIEETLERSSHRIESIDFSGWVGLAKQVPMNIKPKFKSDDDLWK